MTRVVRLFTSALCVISALALHASSHIPRRGPQKAGGPDVAISATAITVTHATPGATIYFASVSIFSAGDFLVNVERPGGSAVADASGNATFTPPKGVRTRSVWLVVDGESGGYTVASPPVMLLREMDLPGNASAGANGALRKVTSNRYSTDLFLIRAGSGMWAARIIDGGTGDDDHVTNGRVSTDISVLTPFAGTSAEVPDKFAKGDILFFVDRNTLEFAVASQGN